jgi:TetR/AcrR family transcriptional repressor of nem operon
MNKSQKSFPTKDKLLTVSRELVLAKGYAGTSVDDICRAARLTKGSFFHYFKSKEDLAMTLLTGYCADSEKLLVSGCCTQEKDPLKRVYGLLDFLIAMFKKKNNKGCLLGSMAQELSDTHPEIRRICVKGFTQMAEVLKKDLTEAKAKYAPRAAFNVRELADHFVVILQGSMLLSRVKQDGRVKENSLKHFKVYLQSLFGK